MNTHDKIELPAEFRSGNSIPVERATITRERMTEILQDAIEADRKSRGEPVAYQVRCGVGEDWYEADQQAYQLVRSTRPCDARALYLAQQPAEPVKLDRYDAGYLGGQDGMPAHVWHDIIRSELDRAYDFYMDQIDRAAPQPAEPVKYWLCCGSTDPTHADRKQPDCYDPDKAKFGTAESHKDSPAEPVKRKRRYAQGTALGEFGVIPMCDQVNDEPVAPQPAEPVKALIDNQESLGEDFQQVLDDNRWDLYVKTTEPVSTHHVHRREESMPCYCAGKQDHPIGHEVTEPVKVPSDGDIMVEWANTPNTGDMRVDLVVFARALLDRYGQQPKDQSK